MLSKQALASKKKWENVPADVRSKRMAELAHKKHAKMSPAETKKHVRKMVRARLAKLKAK